MLEIREATEEDAPELRDYAEALFAERLPGVFSWPVPTLEDEIAFVRAHVEPENSALLVAVVDGVIAGLASLTGGTLAEDRHTGTFGLSVARDFRGRGIGTALIRALLSWARRHRITRVQCWSWASNPRAISLYERLGFEREGVARQAIVSAGRPVDAILLAILLREELG
ncbi:MAG: GNAT family N-acetyltransferase, partial [Actinobacteria bacterium]